MTEKLSKVEETLGEIQKSIALGEDERAEKEGVALAKKRAGDFFRTASKIKNPNAFAEEFRKKATYLNETTDAEGAYAVPIEFAKEVFRVAGEFGVARKYCRIIPMATDTKDITTLTNTVVAYWTDEGIEYTGSKPTLGQVELVAKKVTALISSTRELIDDQMTNQEIWTIVTALIAEAFAEFEDTNVLVTSTKWDAILELDTTNIVTMDTGDGSFADITYDYLVNVVYAVPMKYKKGKRPKWYMHQDIKKYIELLKDIKGQPIFYPSRNFESEQIAGSLLGYPVELTDVMPDDTDDAVSTKFIVFGDLNFFAFGDRRGINIEMGYLSGNWEKDIESLKASERIAGKVIRPEAFGVLKTSSSTTT